MISKLFSAEEFTNPNVTHAGKEFEVNNWAISKFIVKKLYPISDIHPFPLNELMLMTATVCYFKPQFIFEWGTNIGKSARIFHEACKAFKIETEIHSIDLPDDVYHNEHPQSRRGVMVKGIKNVFLHQADGLEKSFALIKEKNPKGKILFFVDGDHSYESVKKELTAILNTVPDAAVLLHDTFFQSEESKYNIGPFKAIKEVVDSAAVKYNIIATNMGLPGMTLLYK
ncbi:MAG: class I SAM-dependent methyltransferase [Sphingobacteriaceae bacterium]|nr:class I SAM-dependent methyltransferase [Sphingobacteriaceae bacterium]